MLFRLIPVDPLLSEGGGQTKMASHLYVCNFLARPPLGPRVLWGTAAVQTA